MKRWGLLAGYAGAAALLAVLVMTIVSASRETGEHRTCAMNLRQVGMALAAYHLGTGSFPYGAVPNDKLPPEQRQSWIVATLSGLFCWHCWGLDELGEIKPSMSCDDPALRRAAVLPLGPVLCPSSPFQPVNGSYDGLRGFSARDRSRLSDPVPSTYVGIAGLGKEAALLPQGDPHAGVFGFHRVTRPRDIKDGSSNTLMVVETSDLRGDWVSGGEATIRGVDPASRPSLGKGRPFGGNHPGKTLALFADGSVRDLRDTIAPEVFESLSTIAGREPLPPDWQERWTAPP